ncbi:hypothetical protein DL770_010710 [Monosporascus sp. CRB-9-2]|nr:hypothetical protein DL770_010710 [Monosporascus sp. CRB-9-2]
MAQVKVGPLRSEPRPSGINPNYLWGDSLGYTIHPEIKEDLGLASQPDKKLRIADIGTGTGIWLINLAQELGIGKETGAKSNIQLDGFDIDIVQCPQPEWLPENIKFHTWNVFEEPEAQFVEPGGWIQWEEVRSSASKVHKIHPSIEAPATEGLLDFVLRESRKYRGGDEWFIGTESVFKDQGFERICLRDHNDLPMLWRYLYEVWLLTVAEFCRIQLRGMEAGAEYSAMVVQACEESRQGAVIQLGRLALMAKLA